MNYKPVDFCIDYNECWQMQLVDAYKEELKPKKMVCYLRSTKNDASYIHLYSVMSKQNVAYYEVSENLCEQIDIMIKQGSLTPAMMYVRSASKSNLLKKYKKTTLTKKKLKLLPTKKSKLHKKGIAPILQYNQPSKYAHYNYTPKTIAYDYFVTEEKVKEYSLNDVVVKVNIFNLANYVEEIMLLKNYMQVEEFYENSSIIYILQGFYVLAYSKLAKPYHQMHVIRKIDKEMSVEYIDSIVKTIAKKKQLSN